MSFYKMGSQAEYNSLLTHPNMKKKKLFLQFRPRNFHTD